jgi:histidine triad (HIT) family protein
MASSIFSKIVSGQIPCYKVAENRDFLAFLDIRPLTKGHTIVIPKKEVDYLFDLDDDTYAGLMAFAREVAILLKEVIPCKRVSLIVLGFEVPHAHIHLIPSETEADVNFNHPRVDLQKEQMITISSQLFEKFKNRD